MSKRLEFRDLNEGALEDFAAGYRTAFLGAKLLPKQCVHVSTLATYKRVIGIYKGEKLIGGYVLNEYPHRCFEYLSSQEREQIIQSLGGAEKVCELVAIWKSREISRLGFIFKVWPNIIRETLRQGRPFIFGCAYRGHGMTKRYFLMSPTPVRIGKEDNDLSVFYYTRTQFFLTFAVGVFVVVPQVVFKKILKAATRSLSLRARPLLEGEK